MQRTKKRMTGRVAAITAALVVALTPMAGAHEGDAGGTALPIQPSSPSLDMIGSYDVEASGLTTDVWAYGDYAYLGSFDEADGQAICSRDLTGVRVVEMTDGGATTSLASFIPAPPGTRNNDVKVHHLDTRHFEGEILVASNEPCTGVYLPRLNARGFGDIPGQGGVSIWDVSDPHNPRALKQNFVKDPIHNSFIWEDGDRAYMMLVSDVDVRDVIVVDITKPQAPREIARVGGPDWPDLIVDGAGGASFLHDMWVQDGIAYLSYWDGGLVLLDVSDPRDPVFLGDSDYGPIDPVTGLRPDGDGHVSVPNHDGSLTMFGDEDFSPIAVSITFDPTDGAPFEVEAGQALFGPSLLDEPLAGTVVWTGGTGCTPDAVPDAPDTGGPYVALIQRGDCFFQDKGHAADASGYDGYIVANSAAGGESLLNMAGGGDQPEPTIPGIFVTHSTGETMKAGGTILSEALYNGWGYLRIMDTSDSSDPTEIGQFATENAYREDEAIPAGDYTMHNVVMDTASTAYISWYHDGMRVVDVSSCEDLDAATCEPQEIAHYAEYADDGHALSNYWGVFLHTLSDGSEVVLGSDRDAGLHIFTDPVAGHQPTTWTP